MFFENRDMPFEFIQIPATGQGRAKDESKGSRKSSELVAVSQILSDLAPGSCYSINPAT